MAITASSVLASNSLEDFRIEFNNLVTDVNAIQLANTFDTRIIFEGSTVDGFETALTLVDPTADRSIVLPNVSGNLIVDGNPISANGESLGTASLEWSDAFFADGSILYFGADQDVTLTHVADTGLLLNTTMVVQFRDSAINIGSPADGDLDINADDEIELNSTLIDINGNVEISGTTAQVGVLTTTATQVATGGITSGSDIVSDTDSTDDLGTTGVRWANLYVDAITATDQITATGFTGTLDGILGSGAAAAATTTTLASTTITASGIIKTDDTTAATSTTDGSLQTDGGLSVAADAVIGDDLFMLSDAAVITFGAGKDVTLTHVHDTGLLLNSTMKLQFNDASQFIHGSSATVLDIGATDEIELTATLVDVVGNFAASGTGAIAGAVTTAALTASGIIKTDDTTAATSTTDGSLQTDGGLSVVLDAVIGDDLLLQSDLAQIGFGADSEITLAHVHNVGLSLRHTSAGDNLPIVLQLKSEEDAIIADEVIGSLEFAAGDSDGTDGATVAAGIHAIAEDTFSASANATKLAFTTGVSETAASSATAKMTLSSGGNLDVVGDITGATLNADGDTSAGDNAAIGYTSAEGLILTGQGSTSDITLKNDADATVFTVPTGTDDILFPDNAMAMFGAGSDLQIYHENVGNTGQIQESGSGGLYIKSDGALIALQKVGGEEMANFNTDGSVQLYFNNVLKFATSAVGVTFGSSGVNTTILTNSAGTSNLTLGATAGDAIQSGGNYNTLIGDEAGTAITTGDNNVAVGYQALKDLTTASFNTAVGTGALMDPTTGHSNTAVGYLSMRDVTDSVGNTGVGAYAGIQVTTGDNNTAVGHNALYSTTTASSNVAIGHNAMYTNVDGATNVAVGTQALDANTSASNNVAIGTNALGANTTGADNTAIGNIALGANTTASNNTAVGATSLDANTTGTQNNAFGVNALTANTEGNYNCAYGANSLAAITTAGNCTAFGANTLAANTGSSNTAIGAFALDANTSALNNIAIGVNALGAITTAPSTIGIGNQAGAAMVTGSGENVLIGTNAAAAGTTFQQTVVIGDNAVGSGVATGNQNVVIGDNAGLVLTSGANNVLIGSANHDNLTTGSNNVSIGQNTAPSGVGVSGEILIGVATTGAGANTARFGLASGAATISLDGSDTSWSAASDSRLKKDVANSTAGLSFINDLRPITFKWNLKDAIANSLPQYDADSSDPVFGEGKAHHGFIAQEIKTVIDAHSEVVNGHNIWSQDPDGTQQVAPGSLVPMLVKAVQELSAQNTALAARITTLEG